MDALVIGVPPGFSARAAGASALWTAARSAAAVKGLGRRGGAGSSPGAFQAPSPRSSTRDGQNPPIGTLDHEALGEDGTVHLGHDDVGQQQADVGLRGLEDGADLGWRRRGEDGVAYPLEHFGSHPSDGVFVLDGEDGAGAAAGACPGAGAVSGESEGPS